jgi:hypothetical protein
LVDGRDQALGRRGQDRRRAFRRILRELGVISPQQENHDARRDNQHGGDGEQKTGSSTHDGFTHTD